MSPQFGAGPSLDLRLPPEQVVQLTDKENRFEATSMSSGIVRTLHELVGLKKLIEHTGKFEKGHCVIKGKKYDLVGACRRWSARDLNVQR